MRRQLRVFSIPAVSDEITCWHVVPFGFLFAFAMTQCTKREKHFLYNSLAILLKATEKQRTTVDLRNEASITGIVENADAYMNVLMRDCIFTDPRGDSFKYDMFFVQARNIRCVHIPPNMRIIPAIKEQLKRLRGPAKQTRNTTVKSFKSERVQRRHQEDLAAVKRILENRKTTETQFTKSNTEINKT